MSGKLSNELSLTLSWPFWKRIHYCVCWCNCFDETVHGPVVDGLFYWYKNVFLKQKICTVISISPRLHQFHFKLQLYLNLYNFVQMLLTIFVSRQKHCHVSITTLQTAKLQAQVGYFHMHAHSESHFFAKLKSRHLTHFVHLENTAPQKATHHLPTALTAHLSGQDTNLRWPLLRGKMEQQG